MSDYGGNRYSAPTYGAESSGGRDRPSITRRLAQEYTEERDRKWNLMQPVETVFDVLSRPNYASAGAARAALEGGNLREILGGAWRGLTGKDKYTYTDVLFRDKEREDLNFWEKAAGFVGDVLLDPTTYIGLGSTAAAKSIAKGVAEEGVESLLRSFTRNIDDVARGTRRGFSQKTFKDFVDAGKMDDAAAYLKRNLNDKNGGIARQLDETYNRIYREALDMTPEQYRARKLSMLDEERGRMVSELKNAPEEWLDSKLSSLKDEIGKQIDRQKVKNLRNRQSYWRRKVKGDTIRGEVDQILSKGSGSVAGHGRELSEVINARLGGIFDLDSQVAHVNSEEFLKDYMAMGQRAFSFMRKPIDPKGKTPFGQAAASGSRFIARQFQVLKDAVGDIPLGKGNFAGAWWTVMNRGSIGKMRRMLGFRNHYQQMVNLKFRSHIDRQEYIEAGYRKRIDAMVDSLPEGAAPDVLNVFSLIEGQNFMPRLTKGDPDISAILRASGGQELKSGDVEAVRNTVRSIHDMLEEANLRLDKGVESGALESYGKIRHYFPLIFQRKGPLSRMPLEAGSEKAAFMKSRQFSLKENLEQQQGMIQWMFGIKDGDAVQKLIQEYDITPLTTDIRKALYARFQMQAKAEARIELVSQFRQLGINLNEFGGGLLNRIGPGQDVLDAVAFNAQAVKKGMMSKQPDAMARALGIRTIDNPGTAFDGYLFDEEVASILERTMEVTGGSDGTMETVRKGVSAFSGWWKSVVTASGGFHGRNFLSNQIVGFLKFGPEWFRPDTFWESMVGVTEAFGDPTWQKGLQKILGAQYGATLAKRRGGHTIGQLVEWARKEGIITQMSKGFDEEFSETAMRRLLGGQANPFSREFKPFEISQRLGSHIESISRFQSFLLDVDRIAKQSGLERTAMKEGREMVAGHGLEWAKVEAKKWFVDYADLTQFEKKVMKNVIPFYSWIRKNLANQITGIVEMPDMYSLMPKTERTFRRDDMADRELYPKWWLEAGVFPISEAADGSIIAFRPNFPFMDLNQLPFTFEEGVVPKPVLDLSGWKDNFLSMAHPAIKTLAESMGEKGYDVFFQREMPDQAPVPRVLRLLTKSTQKSLETGKPSAMTILDGAMRAAGFEDGLRLGVDDRGRLTMDARMARAIDNFLPVLDRIPEMFDPITMAAEEATGLDIEGAITRMTGAKDDYDAMAEFLQVLSRSAGLKLATMDKEKQRYYRAWDIYDQILEDLRSQPANERRSLQARRSREQQFRRLGL